MAANNRSELKRKSPEYRTVNLNLMLFADLWRYSKDITDAADGMDEFCGKIPVHFASQA